MSEDSGVESDTKVVINSKMVAPNPFSEESMDEFYDIFISEDGSELFACKFDGCPNIEKHESDIIEHLRQHFEEVPSNSVDINLSDNSGQTLIECKQEMNTDVECINISDEDTVDPKDNQISANPNAKPLEQSADNWEQSVGIAFNDGKQVFFCRFSDDCHFKTNLRMKIKSHINKHFEPKVKTDFNEYEYWEHCMTQVYSTKPEAEPRSMSPIAASTPRTGTKRGAKTRPKSKSVSKTKSKTKAPNNSGVKPQNSTFSDSLYESMQMPTDMPNSSGLIDINFNHNNTILSLKGMASVKKLEMYIRCSVINGLKYFCCNFNEKCEFKSKRSQETANHVHCAHLGFYLECVRPDCDKIFRTPGSWREHQKNHICNFGLYGYQKGVTGKCRNSYLLQYQDKIIVENNNKAYKCKWKGCGFITRQRTACKRHIHNSHVCPYRKNKQWKKELLKYMEIKSHMTDKPIPIEIKNERVFYCSRPGCQAEMANEEDLCRHETHFCKYRKVVKNGQIGHKTVLNNQKPKAVARLVFSSVASTSGLNVSQSEETNKSIKTKQPIRENGHSVDERQVSVDMPNDGQNLMNDIRVKCEKFIERKLYDGINFILCSAPNCKFTTKFEDKIYDHIQKMHSLVSPKHMLRSFEDFPHLRKRSQSSMDSNDTIVSKMSKSSSNSNNQKSVNCRQNTSEKSIQNSAQKMSQKSTKTSLEISSKKSTQNLTQKSVNSDLKTRFKDYYKVKRIESEPFYFCEYPSSQCRFYSATENELIDHISQTHIVFKCNVLSCRREFKTDSLLDVHKRNHICGFGIKGMKATGVCALENVRKYRREVLVDGLYRYECKVCDFKSEIKSLVLSHAHNRHIHPQPPPPH